ncbi:MAG TPA: dihydrolipoamide acetyltransferase family protein [Symbiobacteriaceae bacterium]|jgi:pyruvate dehydrogenase E2 component (dihydrolipoamide acetyltransferase)
MSAPILMPKLGLTMVEGTVVRWLKQPGQPLVKGEPLLEVTTDKLNTEVPCPLDGTLMEICVADGVTVPVGGVIAHAAVAGEPAGASDSADPTDPDAPTGRVPASPYARALARDRSLSLAGLKGTGPRGMVVARDLPSRDLPEARNLSEAQPVRATPVAARMAAKSGIDLAAIPAQSRIRKADVERAGAAPPASPAPAGASAQGAARREALSPMRRVIARRMAESARTIPHVTLHTDAPVDGLLALRQELNADLPESGQLTVTDFLVLAVAGALRDHPDINASLEGEEVLLWADINVGVAVALDDGLIVPVIRNAGRLSLSQVAAARQNLVTRARTGTLEPHEVTGGTFTVSNLGNYGIDGFTPIINPPEAAILGVGRVVERPVWRDGQWVPAHFITLSLSFDHRLVDGARAARFLARVSALVDRPARLLL